MRLVITVVVSAGAIQSATASPALLGTRQCAQTEFRFYVQILGDESWGQHLGTKASLPEKTTVIAVWSLGGPKADNGLSLYGWTTNTRSGFSRFCQSARPLAVRRQSLRDPFRVRDGWFYGRKFTCVKEGPIVVGLAERAGRRRLTVTMQRTGELVAVGEVAANSGWVRASRGCVENDR